MNPLKLHRTAALCYAVGTWTLLGSAVFYTYSDGFSKQEVTPPVTEDKPNTKRYKTAHMETVEVYKENFVPYTTRLFNLFTSTNTDSPKNKKEDKEKLE